MAADNANVSSDPEGAPKICGKGACIRDKDNEVRSSERRHESVAETQT
jgi:hypothetical protein